MKRFLIMLMITLSACSSVGSDVGLQCEDGSTAVAEADGTITFTKDGIPFIMEAGFTTADEAEAYLLQNGCS